MAQNLPLPGPAEPGHVAPRFEPPPAPRATEEPIVTSPAEPGRPPPNADAISFRLTSVVVEGATVYAAADFLPLYEGLLGTEVTLRQMFDLAAAISAKYRNDGYILSQAVLPAQKISGGVVRIRVIEGFIDRIRIEGDLEARRNLIRDMADKITLSRPMKASALERYLLLINDLPGTTARAVLKPSATEGAADLVIVVSRKPFDGFASLDNRGTRYVGPLQATVGAAANSILGLHERTEIRAIAATQVHELRLFDLSHEQTISTEGTRIKVDAMRSDSRLGFTLRQNRIDSALTGLVVAISHPVVRARAQNLSIAARADLKNIVVDQNGGESRLSEDRIRALRASGSYDFVDSLVTPAVPLVSLEIGQGLNLLGARESGAQGLSHADGRSDFTKLTAVLQRLQSLAGGFSLLFAVNGQYSLSTLLASEEFTFGGAQFGRALEPAELTGEHGVAGKVELRYGTETEFPALKSYQLYAFYDLGAVWNRDRGEGEDYRKSGAATGVGVRANLTTSLSGNLELAFPLIRAVGARGEDGRDGRLFFSIVGRY